MDNFHVNVTSRGREHFNAVMSLFSRKAVAYCIHSHIGMVLFWDYDASSKMKPSPLPYPMDAKAAAAFAWGWLENTEYPRQPDHDGDNEKGWKIFNESWGGGVADDWRAFVAIQPAWAMLGK